MHWVNAQCLLLFLPLSLGLDGTDWAAQFAGMASLDWVYLFLAGSVGILGMIILSQVRSAAQQAQQAAQQARQASAAAGNTNMHASDTTTCLFSV